jgi:RNA polymerase sigma factor (sigma-70 family)
MAGGQVGTALRDLRRLFEGGSATGLSDAQLVRRFAHDHDQAAFEALVSRHGPMVVAVCRGILRNPQDIEDAFQATFLVLVRKARSLWVGDSLAAWLHQVSVRIALQARSDLGRQHERAMALAATRVNPAAERSRTLAEILPVLHEEIDRLPEKYRLPILCCDLEGLTRDQAAERLGWPPGSVAGRLARGRALLHTGLTRRGVDSNDVIPGALLSARSSLEVVGNGLEALFARTSAVEKLGYAGGSASEKVLGLARGILRTLWWTKLRYFGAVFLGATLLACITVGLVGSETGPHPVDNGPGAMAQANRPPARMTRSIQTSPTPPPGDLGADPLNYGGVVLDPNGKPLAGATLYLDYPKAIGWAFVKLGSSGPDGRFHGQLRRAEFDKSRQNDPWMYASVVATAPGFGPVWMNAATSKIPGVQPAENLTLRLARDDVPIEGRVLDAEGRPVAGARISPVMLQYRQNARGEHIPWDSTESAPGYMGSNVGVEGLLPEVITDADGRLRMTGIGRDRMVNLTISGAGIATEHVEVQTRSAKTQAVPDFLGSEPGNQPRMTSRYGAQFIHIAGPSRPIEGVVRERGSGKPIAGVRVASLTILTDTQGRFRITGWPRRDEYSLRVYPAGGQPYFWREVRIAARQPGLEAVTAEIELDRGVLIQGRLTDKVTGRPVRGFIYYHPLKNNPHVAGMVGHVDSYSGTDVQGRFAIAGLPGPGALVVQAGTGDNVWYPPVRAVSQEDRYRKVSTPGDDALLDTLPRPTSLMRHNAYKVIDPPAGDRPFSCDLTVDPGLMVQGRMVDPQRDPLRDVTVFGLRDLMFGSGGVRLDGRFTAWGLRVDQPRRLFFHHPGRNLAGILDLRGDESGPVAACLMPCAAIIGRVVDAAGKPIAGAHFQLIYDDAEGIPHVAFPGGRTVLTKAEARREQQANGYDEPKRFLLNQTTDANGRFRIEQVVPRARFHLSVIIDNREKPIAERTALPAQVIDLGAVPIDAGELHGESPSVPPSPGK